LAIGEGRGPPIILCVFGTRYQLRGATRAAMPV
jgi:hypothetical protein